PRPRTVRLVEGGLDPLPRLHPVPDRPDLPDRPRLGDARPHDQSPGRREKALRRIHPHGGPLDARRRTPQTQRPARKGRPQRRGVPEGERQTAGLGRPADTRSRGGEDALTKWGVLAVLGAAQFLMVLDQAVMNVAISQLVADFDTTVTTIQAVIALYALVM